MAGRWIGYSGAGSRRGPGLSNLLRLVRLDCGSCSEAGMSADGRIWTYRSDPSLKMDWAYSIRVAAATEMVAVFCESTEAITPPVPDIRVIAPRSVVWRRMDIEVEWGFQPGMELADFDGRIETNVALMELLTPLPTGHHHHRRPGVALARQQGKAARDCPVGTARAGYPFGTGQPDHPVGPPAEAQRSASSTSRTVPSRSRARDYSSPKPAITRRRGSSQMF